MKSDINKLRESIEEVMLQKMNDVSKNRIYRITGEPFKNFIQKLTEEVIEEMEDTLDPEKIEKTAKTMEAQMLEMLSEFKVSKPYADSCISKPYEIGFDYVSKQIPEKLFKCIDDNALDEISEIVMQNIIESFQKYSLPKTLKNKIASEIIDQTIEQFKCTDNNAFNKISEIITQNILESFQNYYLPKTLENKIASRIVDKIIEQSNTVKFDNINTIMLSLINSSVGINDFIEALTNYTYVTNEKKQFKQKEKDLQNRIRITNMGVKKSNRKNTHYHNQINKIDEVNEDEIPF